MKLYSILDTKSESLTAPFIARNDELASRQVVSSLDQAGEIPPNLYPDDFLLVSLGEWSESQGITSTNIPLPVGSISILKAKDRNAREAYRKAKYVQNINNSENSCQSDECPFDTTQESK